MSEQDRIAEARRKLLAKRLKGKKSQKTTNSATITPRPEQSQLVTSKGQARLWVLQQLQPNSVAYNLPNVVRIKGDLDIGQLETSIQQIIQRHDTLRTRFIMRDGQLLQDIELTIDFELNRVAVSSEASLTKQIETLLQQPFDLSQAPLIRVHLLTISDNEHVMVTSIHHIVSDEWSIDLFWKELSALYSVQSADLTNLAIQYQDYAYWQHQQPEDTQLTYWRETLSGELPILQLPHDKPRPSVQTFKGHFITHRLSETLSSALQQLSTKANTTLFVTLLSAFNILLHKYSGQDDVLVGTPITNRKYAEIESLIGFFVNTVVVRSQLEDDIAFTAYLNQIRQQALSAIRYGDVPFDQVVDAIKPKRDPSYNPVFQAMLVFQDEQAHQPTLSDLSLEPITVDYGVSKFDLTLFVQVVGSTIELSLEYSSELFSENQIERLLSHYERLLQSIVDTPDALISQLSLLPEQDYEQIMALSQGATVDYPRDALIHELIDSHADELIAVQDEHGTLTYGDLNQHANQLAHYLRSLNVSSDTPVGLCVRRSSDMLVGILGILKAGGAYVPIDPDYPQERINYILADAGIEILITQSGLTAVKTDTVKSVLLDNTTQIAQQPTTAPPIDTTSEDLAYIIYTSGSTGKPKGVRVTHRNLVHSTTARYHFYPRQVDKFLLLSSYAFDSSIVGIFWTLCAGGVLCLPPHQGERDVKQVAQLIEKYSVTHLLALPSLYQILLDFADSSQLKSLNTVMVAGEACPLPLVQKHYDQLTDCLMVNEYGPTEGTVWATAWEIPPDAKTMLIGKPITNMQAYVLDKHRQPVPIGILGELYIGGEGITVGYHKRPELTVERFIDNPFGKGRLYRTGDLARFRVDGNLEFFGRVDFQVKISGYRIELGEIETAFMQNTAVQEAVVLAISGEQANHDTSEVILDDIERQIKQQNAEVLLGEIEQLTDDEVASIVNTLLGEPTHDS